MADSFETDTHCLNAFYTALIRDCEYRIDQNRAGFKAEIARIKSLDAKARYQGNYTDETSCSRPFNGLPPDGKAYASNDFIQVVRDLSDLCGVDIAALPLLLTDPQTDQSREDI